MPSTIRTMPQYQSTDWYAWIQEIDAAARASATTSDLKSLARTTFASRSNGSFTVQDTGQAVGNTGSSPLAIASGVLTHTNTASGSAGYAETNLTQRVGRIGVTFQIPDNTKSGTVAMVAPLASWVSGGVGSNAAAHITLTATAWAYQVADGGSLATLAQGTLSLSSNTDYDLDVIFDGTTARLVLPDGRVVTVTDTRVGSYAGNFAIVELFNSTATSVPLKVSSVRVDGVSLAPLSPTLVSRIVAGAAVPSALAVNHADYDTTISGTVEIGGAGTRLAGILVPPSGKVLFRISSVLEMQAADNVYVYPQFTYDTSGNVAGPNVSICRTVCYQRFTAEAVISGLTPGASGQVAWFSARTGSTTALWHSGGLNGVGATSAIPVR